MESFRTPILLIILLFIPFNIYSSREYPFLDYGYMLETSTGVGINYSEMSEDISSFPSLNGTVDLIVIESFGIGVSDFVFYKERGSGSLYGNNISFDILLRPIFAINFISNNFSKDYATDYFFNSITLHFGGVLQSFHYSKGGDVREGNSLGIRVGLSFNIPLSYKNYKDTFLKLNFLYNFLEDQTFSDKKYVMDGFYFSITFGVSFRFGKSVDWLFGENPNKGVKVEYYK